MRVAADRAYTHPGKPLYRPSPGWKTMQHDAQALQIRKCQELYCHPVAGGRSLGQLTRHQALRAVAFACVFVGWLTLVATSGAVAP